MGIDPLYSLYVPLGLQEESIAKSGGVAIRAFTLRSGTHVIIAITMYVHM